jgi:hypothetical protein
MVGNNNSDQFFKQKSKYDVESYFREIKEQVNDRTYFGNRLYLYLVSEQLVDMHRSNGFSHRIKVFKHPIKDFAFIEDNSIHFIIEDMDFDYRTPESRWHKVNSIRDLLTELDRYFETSLFTLLEPSLIQNIQLIGTIGRHGLLHYDNDADICYLSIISGWYGYSNDRFYFENKSIFLRFIQNNGIKYQFDENSSKLSIRIPNIKNLPKGQLVVSLDFLSKDDLGFFPIIPFIYHLDFKNRNAILVLSFGKNRIQESKIIIDSEAINSNPKIKEIYFDSNSTILESKSKLIANQQMRIFVVDDNLDLIKFLNFREIPFSKITHSDLDNLFV